MTWQLGSFALLALALAAGFAWYERTRPDARIVALVGTLAAFAALGRIAFAALPNVKPTTDIVLISGYALGGAPGFVVGAVAGLASNFFFGQGPWTPWQMAAWGATGVGGAGLARVSRGRVGRWPLALVCAVAGYAFAAVQDVGDWVTYSDHSLAQLGVYVGKGTGFDLVHAGGCLAFALIFGAALIRSLRRFATRLQVTWRPPPALVPVLVVAVLLAAVTVPAARAGAATPASYLLSSQNRDGGYGPAPGQPSSPMYSAWAALGLASDGFNPLDIRRGGASLFAYVSSGTGPSADAGALERTILVTRAAGVDAGGLTSALARRFGRDGSVSGQVNLTAFGVLALRAAGAGVPAGALAWLIHQQNGDGGFGFSTAGAPSDVDDSAAALEALAGAGGAAAPARARAVRFIAAQQNRDGGLPEQGGDGSNAQSTAWAVQGLIAAGVNPGSLHRGGAPSPLAYLSSLIASDGHLRYARGSDQTPVWVTGEAAMALALKPLPLVPVPRQPSAAGAATSRGPQPGAGAPHRRPAAGAAARVPAGGNAAGSGNAAAGGTAARGGAVAGGGPTAAQGIGAPAAGAGAGSGGAHHRRPRRPKAPSAKATAPAALNQLAADAGLATAVLLAPMGLG